MKAQTFKIMGSQSLLEAMWKELLSMGYQKLKDSAYTMENKPYDNTYFICINDTRSPELKDKETFTYLYFGNLSGVKMNKHFNLPEQYNEALEFAKEQLKPKYWKERFNFEVGKWYYFEAYSIKSKTFAKCKGIDDTGFDCTDWIVCDTFCKIGRWCYEDMHNVREATLEEIQQYLPDGHPDKKFVPKRGDYCYHDSGNFGWVFIFEKQEGTYYAGSHSITTKNGSSYYSIYLNRCTNTDLRLATPEEKQWLDACIKAGRFISKEEALETEEDKLLKEAKKRYPVGTKFYPAHVPKDGDYCIVTNNIFEYRPNIDSIWSLTDEKEAYSSNPKYGNTGLNRNVYLEGKWAEIIPEVKKWDVGTFIVYIKGSYGYNPEKGQIMQIIKNESNIDGTIKTEEQGYCKIDREEKGEIKWFATKEEAEEFAKTLTSNIELPFGITTWTINKGSRLVTSIHGKITFDEIISLHKKIEILQSVELLGHTCIIPTIKFGCQEGTFKQLEEIYNAIK